MHRHRLRTTATRAVSHRAIVIGVCLGLILVAEVAVAALTPHEEYIAQWRSLGSQGDMKARQELLASFLSEAETYIQKHPDGAEIVQAKLNKALAIGLYGHRKDEEAYRLFKQILADSPDSELVPEVMYYHARLLYYAFDRRRLDERRAIELELVRRFPRSPRAPRALLDAAEGFYFDAKDLDKAAELFSRVLKEYPGTEAELEARLALISLAIDKQETESARQQIDAFLARFAEAPDIVPGKRWASLLGDRLGDACLRIKDWARGRRVFELVVDKYPGPPVCWNARFGLGRCAEELGDNGAALAAYRTLIERWAEQARADGPAVISLYTVTQSLGAAQRLSAGADRELLDLVESTFGLLVAKCQGTAAELEARCGLLNVAIAQGDVASVQEQVDALLERHREAPDIVPPRAWAWLLAGQVADICLRIEDWDRARETLSTVAEKHKGTTEGLRAEARLVYVAARKGNKASALKQIDDFIERYRTIPEEIRPAEWARLLSRTVADACIRLEAWERAEQCHKTVLELFPEGDVAREALLGLAWIYGADPDGDRVDEQAATLLKVVEEYPGAPDAPRVLVQAARCYEWRIKDKATAERLYKRVVAEYADTTEAHQATGRLIAMPLHAGDTARAEQMLRTFDKTLAEHSDTRQAAQANLTVTRELYGCLWNYPSKTKLRERVLRRFLSIAEKHGGTREAAEALFELALHYASLEYFDAEKAETYALRFLHEDRDANAERYAELVRRMMQDDFLLLQAPRAELVERARGLMRRFPLATARERRQFLLDVEGSYGAEAVDKMLAKIIAFAQERHDENLLKEVLLFGAECCLCKERADQALNCLASLTETELAPTPEEQRRIRECQACCCMLRRQYGRAMPLLDELASTAADTESSAENTPRTKAYYDYWRAVAAFGQGRHAVSKQQFEALISRHPGDRWADRAALYLRHIEPILTMGSDAQVVGNQPVDFELCQ